MYKRLISILIILSLCLTLLSGCQLIDSIRDFFGGRSGGFGGNGNADGDVNDEENFDIMIDEIFADWVTSDSITLNYFLADPEAMGIERPTPTYGKIMTLQMLEDEREKTKETFAQLRAINKNNLSEDRKIIYDILYRLLEIAEITESEDDFMYYTGYVRPLNGIQVQLPVLLAEFNFYTVKDIEQYLKLLEDTVRYFDDIIAFERERAARGFFMSDANVDSVIEQLESYLENRENNLVIAVFDDKIDKYAGLSEQQRDEFKERNRELVLSNLLVAYDNLLAAMRELRGVGAAPGGIASLPRGDKLAHATLRTRVGTDRSVRELERLLEEWRIGTLESIREILMSDSELNRKYMTSTTGQIKGGSAEDYMQILKDTMMYNFPVIDAINYVIEEVHESLQAHISPAFYLVPAVDNYDNNVIYVNPASASDNLTLFTILAHEGYPGHMYQMVHQRQNSSHPIRTMLSNMGYTEGWAVHVELLSYYYAGLSDLEAELLSDLRSYFMLLQAHVDLGVNILNWDKDKVAELLYMDLGIEDAAYVDNFYNAVTGVPINSVVYSLGYIELCLLLYDYDDKMQGNADILDFHTFFLNTGPAPYPIIKSRIG
ncbi:MAG: DUF885 domain-containing protein [Oscillospiraceae bacterium]|nr:DUF885 domain-containing protein [Oscillospiraceae bacterium]